MERVASAAKPRKGAAALPPADLPLNQILRPWWGKLMVGATTRRDYNLLQAVTVVYALIIVFVNIIVDILYAFIDPRIRYAKK